MTKQDLELLLKSHFNELESEIRFDSVRKFRFDYAITKLKIAVEYEGGIFVKGRHTRSLGYDSDCTKYNLAQLNGWLVLRYTCKSTAPQVEKELIKAVVIQQGRIRRNNLFANKG